jgi:Ni/Co efflux regulator RcnB
MIAIRTLLVLAAAILASAVGTTVPASAQTSRTIGPQSRAYDLAASRGNEADDSTQAQSGRSDKSSGPVNSDDEDDKPRVRRRPDDQSTRDRMDRGDYYPERELDRLKGRNYRD